MAAPTFLADRMLGKLVRLLRMLGFDTDYAAGTVAPEPGALGSRVLLTRDKQLLARLAGRVPILYVHSDYPFHQARQIVRELRLSVDGAFTRCLEDNGPLERTPDLDAEGRAIYRCTRCARRYWEGSHVSAMRRIVTELADAPLVPGDAGADAESEDSVGRLAPIMDLHQAMEVLFLRHRLALMEADAPVALRVLRRFAAALRRHIDDERDLVLPLYRRWAPPDGYERGAAPEIFDNEHEKITALLRELEARTEVIGEMSSDLEARRIASLGLLDRERTFVDLLEHHDLRERTYLYPRLELNLVDHEKDDLLERMVGLERKEDA